MQHLAEFPWQFRKGKENPRTQSVSPTFYEPIIKKTLDTIIGTEHKPEEPPSSSSESILESKKYPLIIQYRGKCTEDYARALHRYNAPCMIIVTLRKLRTVLPSLKPPVEKMLKSGIVYKFTCPCCLACYVEQTNRHTQTRFREHTKTQGPMWYHLQQCNTTLTDDNVDILASTSRGEGYLMTLEALWIQELEPSINTKDEYRSRTLSSKL